MTMQAEFTKAEKATISHAFSMIEDQLDRAPRYYKSTWRAAFKLESRQCTNRDWARALMVQNFARGVRSPKGAAELWGIRPGCREAHIIGAALIERARTHHDKAQASVAVAYITDDLMALCDLASATQKASRERRFAEKAV